MYKEHALLSWDLHLHEEGKPRTNSDTKQNTIWLLLSIRKTIKSLESGTNDSPFQLGLSSRGQGKQNVLMYIMDNEREWRMQT